MGADTAAVHLDGVRKVFGTFVALERVSFQIADNEFFTMLGPSGCGKTTLLRMIAGFETPTAGDIHVYGDAVASLPPHRRPVNTVFQNYALFPHLSVTDNVGFGLKRQGMARGEIAARVAEMLELVKLSDFAARRPSQLSGGQQQRVALARAMAPRPKVLLLDEPLSALDLKLRQAMRSELKALQRETGITFVFVTHDQEEALTMSDRIAVMSAGAVQQIGTPNEIYEAPANRFVADFIGETNLIEAKVVRAEAGSSLCRGPGGAAIPVVGDLTVGQAATVSVRPERLRIGPAGGDGLAGHLAERIYLGTDVVYGVTLADGSAISVRVQAGQGAGPDLGAPVTVSIAPGAARVLDG